MRCGLSLLGLAALGIASLAACSAESAPAAETKSVTLAISEAWIAAPPRGAHVAAGYLVISNPAAAPDTLIAASSPRARHVEIHEMKMDGAMMQMRAVTAVPVPARGAVSLAPGGLHLMLIDLGAGLAVGDSVPVTLTFAHAGAVNLTMPVRPRTADRKGAAHGGH